MPDYTTYNPNSWWSKMGLAEVPGSAQPGQFGNQQPVNQQNMFLNPAPSSYGGSANTLPGGFGIDKAAQPAWQARSTYWNEMMPALSGIANTLGYDVSMPQGSLTPQYTKTGAQPEGLGGAYMSGQQALYGQQLEKNVSSARMTEARQRRQMKEMFAGRGTSMSGGALSGLSGASQQAEATIGAARGGYQQSLNQLSIANAQMREQQRQFAQQAMMNAVAQAPSYPVMQPQAGGGTGGARGLMSASGGASGNYSGPSSRELMVQALNFGIGGFDSSDYNSKNQQQEMYRRAKQVQSWGY